MSAASLQLDIDEMLRNALATVVDPGSAGTIVADGKGDFICEVVTAGAEGRTLESASFHATGTRACVLLKTAVGALTITGGASGTEVISNAGDYVNYKVTDANGTKEWRVENNGQADALEDRVTVNETDIARLNTIPAIEAETATDTLTAAQILNRFISGTPVSAATYTLPTAALLVAAIPAVAVNDTISFFVSNQGADADLITVAEGAGGTPDGIMTVAQNQIKQFVIRFTNVTAAAESYSLFAIGT